MSNLIPSQTGLTLRRTDTLISLTNKLLISSHISDELLWSWWKNLDDDWRDIVLCNLKRKFSYKIDLSEKNKNTLYILRTLKEIREFYIDIDAFGISNLLFFENLEYIDLGDFDGCLKIYRLNPLLKLKNLSRLKIPDLNSEIIIEDLCNFKNLQGLEIGDWGYGSSIKNLEFLKYLPNLFDIMIYANENIDISGINHSKRLKNLGLTDINLSKSNIEIIIMMKSLEKLHLGRCVKDISIIPFERIDRLSELILYDNDICDVDELNKLVNLKNLSLGRNRVFDIKPLANLHNLTKLDLYNNEIDDISSISNLKKLEYLDLRNNPINPQDIEWLRQQLPNCKIIF